MQRNLLGLAMIAALAACNADRAASPDATAAATPATIDQPADNVPPATMPTAMGMPAPASAQQQAATVDGADTQAGFGGYGDVKFGTAAADMAKAWGGELKSVGEDANPGCYFMTPTWAKSTPDFNFMIGDGKFVRYATDSAKIVAPGGGKVGMRKGGIAGLYPNLEAQPHKYTDGQYLRVKDPGGSAAVLVFETDGKDDDAKVTQWRVGLPPQVDFVEGCS